LQREILILGGYSGVSDQHGGANLSQMSSRNILLSRQIFATLKSQAFRPSRCCRGT
jgi:hypothetical protein